MINPLDEAAKITQRERKIRKALADLARHDPALFADAVMYADALKARGTDRYDASEEAIEWARERWRRR